MNALQLAIAEAEAKFNNAGTVATTGNNDVIVKTRNRSTFESIRQQWPEAEATPKFNLLVINAGSAEEAVNIENAVVMKFGLVSHGINPRWLS